MRDLVVTCLAVATTGGVLFTTRTLTVAVQDLKFLRANRINGRRGHMAKVQVRHEALRFAKHWLMVGTTLCAVFYPQLITVRNVIAIGVSLLLTINSVLDLHDRKRSLAIIARYIKAKERKS